MALNVTEQIKHLLSNSRHALVIFSHADGDSIGSATALAGFLEKRNMRVDMVCSDIDLPKKYQFLSRSQDILPGIPHAQKFLLTIDIADAGVEELSYDIKDQKLNIFITPKHGLLSSQHVQTAQSEFRYDVIFCINTLDRTQMGSLYQKNAALFSSMPLVNIDTRAENEMFGQINMVDMTASSSAEILATLFKQLNTHTIDAEIATALLTGMIAKTHSFKAENIKPHTLQTAGALVGMGADREFIIHHLYQTKTLSMLRLWGQALAHLNFDKEHGLLSTTITREDFIRSGASHDELYDIIDELIVNSPEQKMTLLLHEHEDAAQGQIHGILQVSKKNNALSLTEAFKPTGDEHRASFILRGMSLKQAEETVYQEITNKLK
ncbi:MAG: hypothetical protein COU33_02185 [Candidatus Magasanikbacteria bacterium CG10_big_fil_rev_8_21_14_0_10_43_6]|uniref:DDH domain-containing protein n=1 Tax=Candidatus Magasanikbacteria bacterium CG10_big_fil_rev_8_21_14_0_10_43_6 TaxID=1974650 RepID=A0A2M6W1G0_9BACT|nr:MAG: hypothetical protein COU33_02185 [Candidatus Magasanikbacteria bacterium CG10_big_fil_rev_8_21_14_0_10_43_6]